MWIASSRSSGSAAREVRVAAKNDYDALVVGAGVGGLTVASLLAHEGWKTALIEQADRVGGRAMTLSGHEIMERGESWYRSVLGRQYTWLAACDPGFDEIVRRRLIGGYQLDIGYHGVSLNGRGYFYDLEQIIGSGEQDAVEFVGNVNATYVDDDWYLDFHAGKMDSRIKAMVKETGLPFLDFFLAPLSMQEADYERWERVSVGQWLRDTSIARHRVLSKMIHGVATLITTINDPDEISIGDIWRYMGQVLNPRFSKGIARWPSGFVKGGIGRWMESIARRFLQKGGQLLLNARMTHIHVRSGKVQGIRIKTEREEVDLSAPIVVSTIPIQDTFHYVDADPFPQDWVKRAASLRGYGAIAPYFGLRHLVLPQEQWDKGTKDTCVIPRDKGLSHDVFMCWNIQSHQDPYCAPTGRHLLTAYAPVTEDEARDQALMQWACKRIVDYFETRYPGFKESVEWALFPVSWRLEGVAKDIQQAGTRKPAVKAPGLQGLFFAGDTVRGYGVAMDCACAAGLICAATITGKDYGVH